MDKTVIKLVIMLAVALLATLVVIGLEIRKKQVRPFNTGVKVALGVVIVGLLVSII